MMPMYRYMDSNPYQTNQTFSFPQYHNPGFRPDSPMTYEPWPYGYGGNYGYAMPFHSCCNHINFPGYNGFRPSYPHPSMASPAQFFGGYPAPYHEAYHYVPPPHYSIEIPKYEFDKNMPPNYHYCGCPNHHWHQNVAKDVKVEEQGPDLVEKKRADESLVPADMKNYPYPIVLVPPESLNGREHRKPFEPEIIEDKRIPSDLKPHEKLMPQEGDQRHGWFPFNLNNIGSLLQGGNREQIQDQQMEDKSKEFPFPIFWMPSYEEDGKTEKDWNASQDQQIEEQRKQFPFPFFWLPYENKQKEEVGKEDNRQVNAAPKFVPMSIAERGNATDETRVNEENPSGQGVVERKEKTANQKSIPVKEVDPHEEEKSENIEGRGRSVPVKDAQDINGNLASKPSGASVKRQSSSPKKSSELPPVCLRVDPLPKKKNSNGNSRSPSPPGRKGVKLESVTDTTKGSASLEFQEQVQHGSKSQNLIPKNSKEVEPPKKEKVIEVDRNITENKDVVRTPQINVNSKDEVSRKQTVGEVVKDGDRCEFNEDPGARKVGDRTENVEGTTNFIEKAKPVGDGSQLEKKTLSDVEAAVRIQSAYRGFEIRRGKLLRKLKQMAEIREHVADVRNRITSLETSGLQMDDKERLAIGESIMRLLLKLDTIQGLLPSLRETRRSLARELVVLQEKLDDLMAKISENKKQQVSTVKELEELNASTNNDKCKREQEKEEVSELGEGSPHGVSEGRMLRSTDSVPGMIIDKPDISDQQELHKVFDDGDQELPVGTGVKSEDLGLTSVELKHDVVNGQFNARDMAVAGNGSAEVEQCGEAPSLVEDKTDDSVARTSSQLVNTIPETRAFEELPGGVTENNSATSEAEQDEQVEMSKNKMELKMLPDVTSSNAGANATNKEAEMPEPANEMKKTEEVEVVKDDDVLQSGREEGQIALGAASEKNGTTMFDRLDQRPDGKMEEQPTVQRLQTPLEEELPPQNEVGSDAVLPLVFASVESQPLSLPVQTKTHEAVREDGPLDIIDGETKKPTDGVVPIEGSADSDEHMPVVTTRETTEDRESPESKTDCDENQNGLANVVETAKENAFVETQPTPVQKSEPKPIVNEASSIDGSNRKLIEENEKLKAMMQKLMEAGNEQLQVISGLTSRVKDLEKKLSRKKKSRTRRCKAASPSGSSRVKPSNNPLKEKNAGVPM